MIRANGSSFDHNWLVVDSHGPEHFLTQDGKKIKIVLDDEAWKPEHVLVAVKWQEILVSGRYKEKRPAFQIVVCTVL